MVSKAKLTLIENLEGQLKDFPVIALVDVEGIPANTMQEMRDKLRDDATIVMTKKRLMKRIFAELEKSHTGISGLEEHFRGMPAFLLTKTNPFRIASLLRRSRTPAPAKAGQVAPRDIVIPKGPTPFAPGPIISELGGIGIKTGVEAGKVAVKEDSTVAREGEAISQQVADVLTRLDIKPMEVGLTMTAAYEEGIVYPQRILEVDETVYIEQLTQAASEAFSVALGTGIVTPETAQVLVGKAARDAFALAYATDILTDETVAQVLAKAERQAAHLDSKVHS